MWTRELARESLAKGEYDGYLKDAVRKLFRRLPLGYPRDHQSMMQEFRLYALEAIRDFDQEKHPNIKFQNYLYGHLRIRSYQWFNWAWLQQNHPRGAGVYHFSECAILSGREFDPTSNIREYPRRSPENMRFAVEFNELKANLTDNSREVLQHLLDVLDEKLLLTFTKYYSEKEIAKLLDFDIMDVIAFVAEITALAPLYISSIQEDETCTA
jgi:hypothetical protein